MKVRANKPKAHLTISGLVAVLGLVTPTSNASGTDAGTPCAMEAGSPGPDRTSLCTGNYALALPLINTDLALVYNSNASKLDQFYSTRSENYEHFGKHWRLQVDASVILDASNESATVVLGDGTSIRYRKGTGTLLYEPVDPRQTQSTLQFSRNNTAEMLMSDGTKMIFAYRDSAEVYHLTSQIASSGRESLNFSRSDGGRINGISGDGFKSVTLSYETNESGSTTVTINNALTQTITLTVSDGLLRRVQFPTPPGSIDLINSFDYEADSDRLIGFEDYLDRVTSVSYHGNGAVRSIIDHKNMATYFAYDSGSVTMKNAYKIVRQQFVRGLLSAVIETSSGSRTIFRRDQSGRVVEIDSNGLKTELTYPDAGSEGLLHDRFPAIVKSPEGLTKTYEYTSATNGGQRWLLVKQLTTSGPSGSLVKSYSYDGLGRPTELRVGSAVYRYEYHADTRLLSDTTLNGRSLGSAQFDDGGRLVLFSDSSGTRSQVGHNNSGAIESVSNPYGSTSVIRDLIGRVTQLTDPEGVTSFGYGTLGNTESISRRLYSGGVYEESNKITIVE